MPTTAELWKFILWGYVASVVLETPVLLLGLSQRHSWGRRLLAGVWLTACTYPIVVLVLPILVWQPYGEALYLIIAETFAPLAECALFYAAFLHGAGFTRWELARDFTAIVVANLVSFGTGVAVHYFGWI